MGRVIHDSIKWLKRNLKVVAAVALGLVVGGAGSAAVMAAIPDTNGVIHACYSNNTQSRVRIIDSPSQNCSTNETAIFWDQNAGPGTFVNNLVNADFETASLVYRDFAGHDLHGANLKGAQLTGSTFQGANLSNAIFERGDLSGQPLKVKSVNFNNANLSGSQWRRGNTTLAGSTFQGANFSSASWLGTSVWEDVDARGATFVDATIDAPFINSNFQNVNFTTTAFGPNTNIASSVVSGANFSGRNLVNFILTTSTATGTDFSNVTFTDAYLVGTNLSTANLSAVTWQNVVCPDETNSAEHGNTCIGHLVP